MKGISHLLLVDAMLGKLGHFLRILGIDTEIADSTCSDTQILEDARAKNRVIVTRDKAFFQRTKKFTLHDTAPPHDLGLYLADQDLETCLADIFTHFGISPIHYLWDLSREQLDSNLQEIRLDNDAAKKLSPEIPFISRCSVCNAQVMNISREEAQSRIPQGTFEHHQQYWLCSNPKCGKVYWRGSHWNDIHAMLIRVAGKYTQSTKNLKNS
ncbi:MAG: hypothetical protein E4G98_00840 [Promethearchaeota archaeon]|nr:MAG: hypothetical protein E4G98_00840 [Candidatus Lokiarchaeota archaeon]